MSSGRRVSASIYDYPEHLNPFYEGDNHNKLRFWNIPKKKSRSNSFSFQSVKDFKSTLKLSRLRSGTTCSLFTTASNIQIGYKFDTSRSEFRRKFLVLPKLLNNVGRTFSIRRNKDNETTAPTQTNETLSYKIERENVHRPSPTQLRRFTINPKKQQSNCDSRNTLPSRLNEHHRYSERTRQTEVALTSKSLVEDDKNPFNDTTNESTSNSSTGSIHLKPRTPPRKKKRAPPPPPLRQSSLVFKQNADATSKQKEVQEKEEKSTSTEDNKETADKTHLTISQIEEKIVLTEDNTAQDTKLAEDADLKLENTSKNSEQNCDTENVIETTESSVSITDKKEEIVEISVTKSESTVDDCQKENLESDLKIESNISKIENIEPSKTQEINNVETLTESKTISTDIIEDDMKDTQMKDILVVESISSADNDNSLKDTTVLSSNEVLYKNEVTMSSSETDLSSDIQLEQKQQKQAIDDSSDLLEMVQKLHLEVQKLTDDTNNNVISEFGYDRLNNTSRVKTEMNITLDSNDISHVPTSPRFIRLRKDNDWIKPNE